MFIFFQNGGAPPPPEPPLKGTLLLPQNPNAINFKLS